MPDPVAHSLAGPDPVRRLVLLWGLIDIPAQVVVHVAGTVARGPVFSVLAVPLAERRAVRIRCARRWEFVETFVDRVGNEIVLQGRTRQQSVEIRRDLEPADRHGAPVRAPAGADADPAGRSRGRPAPRSAPRGHRLFRLPDLPTRSGLDRAGTRGARCSLLAGYIISTIATSQFVSVNTVKTQLRSLYRKLGVHTRVDAVAAASRVRLD
ncbi:helix-turn-helix transcriptional regulator [Rhodococcus pyridinivorans]|nr:helix-turn-helix transcriptional regulator [Rhodococcus pyridinivorans]